MKKIAHRTKVKNYCTNLRRFFCVASVLVSVLAVAEQKSVLEEIVVTANKRAESSQTIPLSISAITGKDLEARGVTEFTDYAISIPNLSFGAEFDGVLSGRGITIRGIQGVNTTSFYIDDTPLPESIDPRATDIERIEVLRSPSGTLYGARSLGGVIRQVTKKARIGEYFGKVKINVSQIDEAGDPNNLLSTSVNVPLGDNAAVLFSGLYEHQAGVFDRVVGSIPDPVSAPATIVGPVDFIMRDVDDKDTFSARLAFLWRPGDQLTVEPSATYQRTQLDGFPLADIKPDNFKQNREFNTPEGGEDKWVLYALNFNYETDAGTFTSASSYFDRTTFEFEGSGSFVNFLQFAEFQIAPTNYIPLTSPIFQTLEFNSFTQEFRFASDFNGDWNFVTGAFYQKINDDEDFVPRNFARGLGDILTGVGSLSAVYGDLIFTAERPSTTEELGVFSEVTYNLTDKLSATLGARYFDTEFSFKNTQAGLGAGVPLADNEPLSSVTPIADQTKEDDGFNFKGALEYQATDDLLIYGLVAEGFRIGGANGPLPAALGCPNVDVSDGFESDALISYEVGVKADIRNSRINASVFYIDFDNIQQRIQFSCGFQYIENLGSARSQGIELEFLTQPVENLTLGLNIGYTDAAFTETVNVVDISDAAVFSILDGAPLQQVPEWTGSLSIDYVSSNVIDEFDFFIRVDASYVDESISRVNSSSDPRARDSYEQVNLRFGLRDEKVSYTLFVKNLTDDIANLSDNRSLAAETPGRTRFVVSRPRIIGVEIGVNF